MIQFHFTVGVRGSISNVDRTEPLSFMSKGDDDAFYLFLQKQKIALGITSQTSLEKIRGGGETHL